MKVISTNLVNSSAQFDENISRPKRVAIMQPYFFPYIGYYQLVAAVDVFVFYDDVNFIKGGWINRNKILNNNKNGYFTLPLSKSSSYKRINEIVRLDNHSNLDKTIIQTYNKAPYFDDVYPIISKILESDEDRISQLSIQSIKSIFHYLEIEKSFILSSEMYPETKNLKKQDRIIEICKKLGAEQYINSYKGKKLYSKEYFKKQGLSINYLRPGIVPYRQYGSNFKEGLSIIDVLMFNKPEMVKEMMFSYNIVYD